MNAGTSIGRMVDGRFEVYSGPHAYRGKKGCRNVMCTRSSLDDSGCFGWHCSHCDEPSSYQGHLKTGRYVDHEYRPFKDGTPRLSCQPGFEEATVA